MRVRLFEGIEVISIDERYVVLVRVAIAATLAPFFPGET